MALDQSALLALVELMKAADGGELMRRLLARTGGARLTAEGQLLAHPVLRAATRPGAAPGS